MKFEFASKKLERLYVESEFSAGFGSDVVRAFRKVMQLISAARDERDLRQFKSRRFEKLKGERAHQHSLRLNDQWRLIVEVRKDADGNVILVVDIEDYH